MLQRTLPLPPRQILRIIYHFNFQFLRASVKCRVSVPLRHPCRDEQRASNVPMCCALRILNGHFLNSCDGALNEMHSNITTEVSKTIYDIFIILIHNRMFLLLR